VSALDFMTPSAAPSASLGVLARSPMERLARAAGARFEARDGWNVPVSFGDASVERSRVEQTVAFADRSAMRKLELHGEGVGLTMGVAEQREGAWWCPVTPLRTLVLGGGESVEFGTHVDLTCGLVAMTLAGPLCRELLARFCAIDVRPAVAPVGSFRPGSVARTPGYVLVEAPDRLLILVGWARGQYLWEVVADAASHLGGGPVGVDALVGAASRA
jgi:hypothetical protein